MGFRQPERMMQFYMRADSVLRACSQSFIVLLSAHKQAHAALKMRAKAGFGCAFCLACTRFCTKIRYKKDREQALSAKTFYHAA